MKPKLKKLFIIPALGIFFVNNIIADSLKVNFLNKSNSQITVQYLNSNTCSPFTDISIPADNNKTCNLEFGDDFYLNLKVSKQNSATKVQIVHNYTYNKILKNYIPCSGPLSGFGCAWSDKVFLNVRNIYGYESLSWLPLFHDYHGKLDIIIQPDNQAQIQNKDIKLEFTLFAVSKEQKIQDIELNSSDSSTKELNKNDFKLNNWGIKHKSALKPETFYANSKLSRWVDLIVHNYTISSYIFYALSDSPQDKRINLNLGETIRGFYTIFYPPQSQLRSASFKFDVLQNNNLYTPIKSSPKHSDRLYMLLSADLNETSKVLEYIPIQIITDIRISDPEPEPEKININAYKKHAYYADFMPINVSFKLTAAEPEKFMNKIRIPLTENGRNIFSALKPMNNIKIKVLPQSNIQKTPVNNRTGIRYLISGESKTGEVYYYKVILIAPPFLAGNTPGYFSPGPTIMLKSELGNYMRYPLHMYILPSDKNGNEFYLTGKKQSSDLPSEMIGSVEYFISDTINESAL